MITAPNSSWIDGFNYDAQEKTVTVLLKSGRSIKASNAPSWLPGLLAAHQKAGLKSAGKAFNRLVKGRLELSTVSPAPTEVVDLVTRLRQSIEKARQESREG